MREITVDEFMRLPKDIYDVNEDFVKLQLTEIYKNISTNTCWSPMGFIGVEVNEVMHKGKTTYDILLEQKIKINDRKSTT